MTNIPIFSKAHLDQVFAEAKIEIAPTSKVWEPERAYEKRLTAIMAKDNRKWFIIVPPFVVFDLSLSAQVPKVKKSRKGAKGGAAATSSAEESEGEKTLDEDVAAPRPRPRPKPKRATRANPVIEEEAAPDESNKPDDPVTPKARPRPRPIHRDIIPPGSLNGSENEQNSLPGSPQPPVTPSDEEQGLGEPNNNETATPKSSLKRPRTNDNGEAIEAPNGTSDADALTNVYGTPDMQIRRKRIRH